MADVQSVPSTMSFSAARFHGRRRNTSPLSCVVPPPLHGVGPGASTGGLHTPQAVRESLDSSRAFSPLAPPRDPRDQDTCEAVQVAVQASRELDHMRRIFNAYDEDGSQTIDQYELYSALVSLGYHLSPEQLTGLLEQVNVNASGAVDVEQFERAIHLWKDASRFKIFGDTAADLTEKRIEEASTRGLRLFLPDAWPVVCWQVAVMAFLLYSCIEQFTLAATYESDQNVFDVIQDSAVLIAFDVIASAVYVADIVVSCITARRVAYDGPQRREIIDDPWLRFKAYAVHTPLFAFDLLALVPWHRVFPTGLHWFGLAVLPKAVFKPWFAFFDRSGRARTTPLYVYVHYYLLQMVVPVYLFLIMIGALAAGWTLVARWEEDDIDYAALPPNTTGTAHVPGLTNSLVFVLSTLTTTGFGGVAWGTRSQMILASLLCLGGTLLNGVIIGSIVNLLSKTDIKTERENRLRETLAVCEHFAVPKALQEEVLNFQDYVLRHSVSAAYRDLVSGLPDDMQNNLTLFQRYERVARADAFAGAHRGALVAIAEQLTPMFVCPDMYVARAAKKDPTMYFVGYGFLDVLTPDGVFLELLGPGGNFGSEALFHETNFYPRSLKAITFCQLHCLSRADFDALLDRFPKFKKKVSQQRKLASTRPSNLQQPRSPNGAPLGDEVRNPLLPASPPPAGALDTDAGATSPLQTENPPPGPSTSTATPSFVGHNSGVTATTGSSRSAHILMGDGGQGRTMLSALRACGQHLARIDALVAEYNDGASSGPVSEAEDSPTRHGQGPAVVLAVPSDAEDGPRPDTAGVAAASEFAAAEAEGAPRPGEVGSSETGVLSPSFHESRDSPAAVATVADGAPDQAPDQGPNPDPVPGPDPAADTEEAPHRALPGCVLSDTDVA